MAGETARTNTIGCMAATYGGIGDCVPTHTACNNGSTAIGDNNPATDGRTISDTAHRFCGKYRNRNISFTHKADSISGTAFSTPETEKA